MAVFARPSTAGEAKFTWYFPPSTTAGGYDYSNAASVRTGATLDSARGVPRGLLVAPETNLNHYLLAASSPTSLKQKFSSPLQAGIFCDLIMAEKLQGMQRLLIDSLEKALNRCLLGDEGFPPTLLAVKTARGLLADVANKYASANGRTIRPFHVAPLDDGGLLIEWCSPLADLEVYISPGGDLGYLLADRHSAEEVFTEENYVLADFVIGRLGRVFSA